MLYSDCINLGGAQCNPGIFILSAKTTIVYYHIFVSGRKAIISNLSNSCQPGDYAIIKYYYSLLKTWFKY